MDAANKPPASVTAKILDIVNAGSDAPPTPSPHLDDTNAVHGLSNPTPASLVRTGYSHHISFHDLLQTHHISRQAYAMVDVAIQHPITGYLLADSLGEVSLGLPRSLPVNWFCHNCGNGPMLQVNHAACIKCDHVQCPLCQTEVVDGIAPVDAGDSGFEIAAE